MHKNVIASVGLAVTTATLLTWAMPSVSGGEDFFEKMKKAMEDKQRQRQLQQQQQQQQKQQQTQPNQTSQSQAPQAQPLTQSQQQRRSVPAGGQQAPAEKPVPSPEFGTPEGTAKIAAKAGFLEVVGIKLGMPVKEAQAALKAYNAGYSPGPITLREYEALPGVVMTPVLYAPNPGGPNATSGDEFNLLITYAPNEAYVWGIVRSMGFGTNATRPPVDSTLAGLRQKYGPESAQQPGGTRLIWIYDAQGQQVMAQKALEIYNTCSSTWTVGQGGSIGGNNPDRNHQYSNSFFDQQLKDGYYYGTGGMGSPGGACHTHSLVDVYYTHATPAGSAADLMISMTMGVYNRHLEASGVTASHMNLMGEVAKLNNQRREQENKRGGMTF
jgi:type II secretory pathway pseudopilin PulG